MNVCEGCGRDTVNKRGLCSECLGGDSKRNPNALGRDLLPEDAFLALTADEYGEDDYSEHSDADSCNDWSEGKYDAWLLREQWAARRDTSKNKRPPDEWPYNNRTWGH